VEAPELARRIAGERLVQDLRVEALLHQASNEYRARFYKARNALEAIRKREAAEATEARKADRAGCRRSADRPVPADRAGNAAPAPAGAEMPRPDAPACGGRGKRPNPETNPHRRRKLLRTWQMW
jgi:hypothetical protein